MRCPYALTGVLLLASFGAAEEKKMTGEETAIRGVLNDQVVAWNKGDLEGFMKGYWNSNDLSFYSGKDKKNGWQVTLDRYRKRYQGEGKEMGKRAFTEVEVTVLPGDHAIVKGRWKVDMKKETIDGLFTLVMKKMPDGWRIIHDHTSG